MPKDEVAEIERCDNDDKNTHPAPAVSENIDANKLRESRDPDVNDDDDDTIEYAVGGIVKHTQRNRRTHYLVRLYEYASKHDTVEPPEHVTDHFNP